MAVNNENIPFQFFHADNVGKRRPEPPVLYLMHISRELQWELC